MIDAGTKEKYLKILKREGIGLFFVLDSDKYRRKARPYCGKEKYEYAKIINELLKGDADCNPKIPIYTKGGGFCVKQMELFLLN